MNERVLNPTLHDKMLVEKEGDALEEEEEEKKSIASFCSENTILQKRKFDYDSQASSTSKLANNFDDLDVESLRRKKVKPSPTKNGCQVIREVQEEECFRDVNVDDDLRIKKVKKLAGESEIEGDKYGKRAFEELSKLDPSVTLDCKEDDSKKRKGVSFYADVTNISTVEGMKRAWKFLTENQDAISSNDKFINLASGLLKVFEKYNCLSHLQTQTNPDLKYYVRYLLEQQSQSFKLTQIPNPIFRSLRNPTKYNIHRLVLIKYQLASLLVSTIKRMIKHRTYENQIRFNVSRSSDTEGIERDSGSWGAQRLLKTSMSKKPEKSHPLEQMPLSDEEVFENASHWLGLHEIQRKGQDEVGSSLEDYFQYKFTLPSFSEANYARKTIERLFVFSPLFEFNLRQGKGDNVSMMLDSHNWGAVTICKGESKCEKNKTTCSAQEMPFVNNLLQPTSTILMNAIELSFRSRDFIPFERGINAQVCYYLLENATFKKKRLLRPANFHRMGGTSSFTTGFNLDNLLESEEDLAKEMLTSILLDEKSTTIIEPVLLLENLNQIENWSYNYKWDAYEAPPYMINLLLFSSYLKAVTSIQYKKMTKELYEKALNRDKESLKLLAIFNPKLSIPSSDEISYQDIIKQQSGSDALSVNTSQALNRFEQNQGKFEKQQKEAESQIENAHSALSQAKAKYSEYQKEMEERYNKEQGNMQAQYEQAITNAQSEIDRESARMQFEQAKAIIQEEYARTLQQTQNEYQRLENQYNESIILAKKRWEEANAHIKIDESSYAQTLNKAKSQAETQLQKLSKELTELEEITGLSKAV